MLAASIVDLGTSTLPSPSQRAASIILKDFSNEQIIAWLTLLRSLQSSYHHFSASQTLSRQHIDALSTLKGVPDSLVLAWLQSSRCTGQCLSPLEYHRKGLTGLLEQKNSVVAAHSNATLSDSSNATTASLSLRQFSLSSVPESSSSSLSPMTPYSRNTSGDALRTSTSQTDFLVDYYRQPSSSIIASPSSSSTNSIHTHWCITCEKPKAIYTCDGWKRHMKEHETIFPCMPQGPVRITDSGPVCAFCSVQNPDQNHLDSHSIQHCLVKPRSYTRKANLVKHLEVHGVPNRLQLADEWQFAFSKKCFSCGFCIAIFYTINDQLNHIDLDHFRRSDDILNWDVTKVIKGLLLQPGLDIAWRSVSVDYTDSGFSWDPATSKSLQLRLELAEENLQELAVAAFNGSTYDWSHHNYDEPGLTMTLPTQSDQAVQSYILSVQDPPITGRQINNTIPPYRGPATSLDGTRYPEPYITYPSQSKTPNGNSNSGANTSDRYNNTGIHPPLFPVYDIAQARFQNIRPEHQTEEVPTLTKDSNVTIPTDAPPGEPGLWPPMPQPHVATIPPKELATVLSEQIDILANDHGSTDATSNTQSSQSDTQSSHHTIPETSARKKSPSFVSQIKKKFSHHKSKDQVAEPEVPMDIDLYGLMSFM